MKNNYFFKRILSAVLLLMASSLMWAWDFQVDGIYYNVNEDGESVEVTENPEWYSDWNNRYMGDIVIPATVAYEGTTYSVTSIGESAFEGCFYLTSVEIPNSVTSIESCAFEGCSSLTSIEIPSSVTSIGYGAFNNCSSLTSVEIPNSVTSIGYGAFAACSSLTSIIVADDNPNYDSREGCNAIIETASNTLIAGCQNTVIPNSVTSIGDYAFHGCSSLTSINIPDSVTSIGEFVFYGCGSLTSVIIPNNVTSIGGRAFAYCSSLTSIVIPNSVTSIGELAFSSCYSLTSVIIPNSVTSIGDYAFSSCYSLTSVTCYAKKVPALVGNYVFSYFPKSEATLYVPASALEAYKASAQWNTFGTILPIGGDATGITSTTVEQETDATYYTLDGVSVKNPTKKGIYIKNGKKVLFR